MALFPLLQWLRERATILPCQYMAYLVYFVKTNKTGIFSTWWESYDVIFYKIIKYSISWTHFMYT